MSEQLKEKQINKVILVWRWTKKMNEFTYRVNWRITKS